MIQEPGALTLADTEPEPEIFEEHGKLYHLVEVPVGDGTNRQAKRPVARSLEEARKEGWDYLDPTRGWFLHGYKWRRDQTPEQILSEASPEQEGDQDES